MHGDSKFRSQSLKYPFAIQNVKFADRLSKNLWFINEANYLIPGFALQLCDFNNEITEFAKKFI